MAVVFLGYKKPKRVYIYLDLNQTTVQLKSCIKITVYCFLSKS